MFYQHENYDPTNILNDIAIIQLNEDVELNEYVQIACLPKSNIYSTYANQSSWIIGWGTTKTYKKASADSLQNAQISILNNSFCNKVIQENTKNWNSQICAGTLDGSRDTCQGIYKIF